MNINKFYHSSSIHYKHKVHISMSMTSNRHTKAKQSIITDHYDEKEFENDIDSTSTVTTHN